MSSKMAKTGALLTALRFWKSALLCTVPVAATPLLVMDEGHGKAFQCAYVVVLMAAFWATEALPLAVTSLIPVVLLPILGIMTTDEVGKEYLKEANLMFIASMLMALAVEHSNLHQRLALNIIAAVGTSPRRLLFGFMFATMFLSMWISNTASTALMVPIVKGILEEMEKHEKEKCSVDENRRRENVRNMFYLSVAYAANIGGTGTLTGTSTNLVFKGIIQDMDGQPVTFSSWMGYAVPQMLLCTLVCWVWLQIWFLGWTSCRKGDETENKSNLRTLIGEKLSRLGRLTQHEFLVLVLFVTVILLWFFRAPQFTEGWASTVSVRRSRFVPTNSSCTTAGCAFRKTAAERTSMGDATAGMWAAVLLFVIPATTSFWPIGTSSRPSASLLDWETASKRMPWSVLLMKGGSFALARATVVSGLSAALSRQLGGLADVDRVLVAVAMCLLAAAATEVVSNVAVCSIMLPILRDLAVSLHINPLYLMLPTTLACSYAFMLPVATPPNAIVYAASGMKTSVMFKCGSLINLLCVGINIGCLNTYAVSLFSLNEFPEWAKI